MANAGPDKTITLPTNSTSLTGSGTDTDGSVASYTWAQVSGPNNATFSSKTVATPTISGLVAGPYVFSLVVTDNAGATSAADQVAVTVNSAAGTGQQVVSFSLINADSDQPLLTLAAGQVLNLAALPTRNLNIRANTNPTTVGSVQFALSGAATQNRTETAAPYALFADASGDYYAWTPPVGSYTLQATPYTGAGATGTAGTPLTLSFSVVDQAARTSASQPATVQATQVANVSAQVQVYPNPSEDGRYQVLLPAAFQGEVNYALVSAQGLIVRRGTAAVNGGALKLDFSQQMLAEGIYQLQLTGNKAQAHIKLQRR
ncbi:PKD domain-containing protein [Hymenobacter volaticus]|uniref:T9SS type A sorting domain-containing protein n=1 Tax=Hymenobacter volaticus TaxID=2932254 RepID=A0ABY4GE00_9BACT|nr:hypothetical protein [Hymenobacter volaticus]UOQ68634.1 hypothetical protein MUN86_24345 [Hymenobacter volaticus]